MEESRPRKRGSGHPPTPSQIKFGERFNEENVDHLARGKRQQRRSGML